MFCETFGVYLHEDLPLGGGFPKLAVWSADGLCLYKAKSDRLLEAEGFELLAHTIASFGVIVYFIHRKAD